MFFNKKRNIVCILILSIILLFLLITSIIFYRSQKGSLPLTLKITSNDVTETIKPWYDDNGKWYFFLPSYSSDNNTVLIANKSGCYIQDRLLSYEQSIALFDIDTEYHFKRHAFFSDTDTTVVFMRSANVATMYISTHSGNMDKVHSNKENKENINISLYKENGKVSYNENKYNAEISGRGNTTWSLGKKPYKINLFESAELLGMPSAKKWVLLANGYDETNLRNKLIYDFAQKVDMGWTPHCEYVDLYINGEYNGLYLLSEKIDVNDNRLNLNNLDGDFLFQGLQAFKVKQNDIPFTISDNQNFVIDYPKDLDEGKIAEIRSNVFQLDAEINEDNLNRIDLNSWIKRFLIDEVFINADAVQASSYYYYDTSSDKFFAGPIWDYDLSFGNDASPYTSKSKLPNQIWGLRMYWYDHLYQNEVFYSKIKQVYQDEFLPKLERLLVHDLSYQAEKICDSSVCNSIRWDAMFKVSYSEDKELDVRINELSKFLIARMSYLNPIWCTEKEYKIVKWYAADKTTLLYITLVEQGTAITEFPTVNGAVNDSWNNFSNDLAFDTKLPVTENINLYSTAPITSDSSDAPTASATQSQLNNENEGQIINFLKNHWSILLLFVLCTMAGFIGMLLLFIDIRRNGKGVKNG